MPRPKGLIPEEFSIGPAQVEWAQEKTPDVAHRSQDCLEAYRDWRLANGKKCKDEAAGWRNWMRREQQNHERYGRPMRRNGPLDGQGRSDIVDLVARRGVGRG